MKKYLLDTNIYVSAYDRFYRHDYFPTFWKKFSTILNEQVVIPKVVKDEITKSDWFLDWLKEEYRGDVLNHKDYAEHWQTVLDYVQSCGLYNVEKVLREQAKGWANNDIADPWLVAIAKEEGLIVVSEEGRISNLGKGVLVGRATVPDICDRQGVRCIGRNEFFGEIGLSI